MVVFCAGCIFPWVLANVFTAFLYQTARACCKNGGDDGNRTHDPLLAGQVLSQLSYTPIRAFEETILKN